MATPYLGEIRLVGYAFAPIGWHFCDGSLIPIAEYSALFDLVGTTYGGNGQTTFALPDLRSRVAIHMGGGYAMGEQIGQEEVTLTTQTMPSHAHGWVVNGSAGTQTSPKGNFSAVAPDGLGFVYEPYAADHAGTMNGNAIGPAGGNQPHSNIQPYQAINYIIAMEGIFPSQG